MLQNWQYFDSHRLDHCLIVEIRRVYSKSQAPVSNSVENWDPCASGKCMTLNNLCARERKMLLNEIQIYQEFFNYVVQFHGFDLSNDRIVIVLDLCSEENSRKKKNNLSDIKAVSRRRGLCY